MKPKPPHLNNFIRPRQIVQHYTGQGHQPHRYPSLYHHPSPYFIEDEVFQELERTAIVEDYQPRKHRFEEDFMEVEEPDQRMLEEEPYEEYFPPDNPQLQPNNSNLLDSESSGRELPCRKSSVSSMSDHNEKDVFKPLLMRPQACDLQAESFIRPTRCEGGEERKNKARREIGSSAEKRERL
jgi:hypothetical protein